MRSCTEFTGCEGCTASASDDGHWREVPDHVEGQRLRQRGLDHEGVVGDQDRVAVGGALRHVVGRDVAGRPRLVLEDEVLPERLVQLRDQVARDEVGAAARRELRDQPHWLRGPALRAGAAGHPQQGERENDSSHGFASP
jgi:hypothetical protein